MATRQQISATTRDVFGKKLKRYRSQNMIPANLYGKTTESIALWISTKELDNFRKSHGEGTLVDLNIESEKKARPAIVRNIQGDHLRPRVAHVDLQQVNLKEKIQVTIPIHLIGESPVVASATGMLETPLSEIEIEALPTDLPEHVEVDVTNLTEIGQQIHVSDLQLPHGVEVLTDKESLLVSVVEPVQEEEVEAAPVNEEAAVDNVETVQDEKAEEEEKSEN